MKSGKWQPACLGLNVLTGNILKMILKIYCGYAQSCQVILYLI